MKLTLFKSIVILLMLCTIQLNAQTYERIISLAPSITEDLDLLKVQERLVGMTNYCKPETSKNIPIVASAVDINIERIVAQQPDLVIATSLTSLENLEMMRTLGLKVFYLPLPKSLTEINDQFIALGQMLGAEVDAQKIVDDVNKRIENIQNTHDFKGVKMFMEIGTNPLFCVIPNTFLNDYIEFIGGDNIASDLTNGAISRESVIIRNPDVIFIVTMGGIGEEETRVWQSYPHLNAVKKDQVYVIDSEKACSPTPLNFIESIEKIIHKMTQKQ